MAPALAVKNGVKTMFVFVRALTYATLFIGFLLVFLPRQVLSWSGIVRPTNIGAWQIAGLAIGAIGAAIAVWCILTFVVIGRGTPAPFDPPRKLVAAGPYRFVRNPMYLGAALALSGAALYYGSWALIAYSALFLVITHVFVVAYEEPTLRTTFGEAYVSYCARVHRWVPTRPRS